MDLRRICVYCSSSPVGNRNAAVEQEIRVFGGELVRRGIALVYGGSSRGLMGALADEVLAAGGRVIGVVPKALEGREAAHRGLTELKVVSSMQLGIHGKPVVFANIGGYFDPLLAQFDRAIASGYARAEDKILYAVASDSKSILTFLEGAPVLSRKAGDWA